MLASTRYRIMIPGQELVRRCHDVKVGVPDGSADVAVFSKHFNAKDPEIARNFDGPIVYDVCDDHFTTEFRDHYLEMIDIADRVTCNTAGMARRVEEVTGKTATIIPDPYEIPEIEPRFEPTTPPRLMWFGNAVNLDTLSTILPGITEAPLLIVTNGKAEITRQGETQIVPWSHENMVKAFAWCDIVIIPTIDHVRKNVKSENRVIESVRSGRYVCAGALDSYRKFAPWIHVGDIGDGIRDALNKPRDEIVQRLRDCQAFIREIFPPRRLVRNGNRCCQN